MSIVPRLNEKEMLKQFKPLNDWVVVRKHKGELVTSSGIILQEDRKDFQCKQGVVVKVGPGTSQKQLANRPLVKPGDSVYFSAFAGMEVPMPEGYLIMKLEEILLVGTQECQ